MLFLCEGDTETLFCIKPEFLSPSLARSTHTTNKCYYCIYVIEEFSPLACSLASHS